MRSKRNVWLGMFGAALSFLIVGTTQAELQNVEVGGEIRTRGRWYINTFNPGAARQVRVPNTALWGRPIGGNGVSSQFKWNDDGADWSRIESSVLLNVKADFTQNVSAFFELYDFFIWGEDFRSQNYITGVDTRANSADDIEINQAYIEVRKIFDSPVSIRIGRQALKFGKGWLVSDMLTPSQYASHDAIRLTFQMSDFTVDAFASRLAPMVQDPFDNVDLYGIYGTWSGFKPLSVSAYYFLLHDPRPVENVQGSRLAEHVERLLNLDKYGHTYLHTVGIRLFGGYEGFDYDVELAYQFGRADALGATFRPVGKLYGDQDLEYNNWGFEGTLGYTFREVPLKPRPFFMACVFSGEDNRDISFVDWINPFYRPKGSVSFNRLFSDKNYMPTVNDNGWLSNFWQATLGVQLQPTEKILINLQGSYDGIVAPFAPPVTRKIFGRKMPIAPFLSFWTESGSDDIGWELAAWVKYNYSKDLYFMLYGNYLFVGNGLARGAFIQANGTDFCGGADNDYAGYIFWMAVLKF